jgi:DNA repair protein RadC
VTRAIADVGRALNISVHDHIIMGSSGHASLRAKGLI